MVVHQVPSETVNHLIERRGIVDGEIDVVASAGYLNDARIPHCGVPSDDVAGRFSQSPAPLTMESCRDGTTKRVFGTGDYVTFIYSNHATGKAMAFGPGLSIFSR